MANELRVRTNFVGGLVEDNPLSSGATTLTSAGLASAPAIDSTQHWPIILDPDGRNGNPEIAYITAHTAGATTATITKGHEGTTARAHDRDTPWVHGPTIKDFDASGGGSGLIGLTAYEPGSAATKSTTSTSLAAFDTTNMRVTFVAPPSGKVLVKLSARCNMNTTNVNGYWGLLNGAAQVGKVQHVVDSANGGRKFCAIYVTGLTPGTTYNLDWAGAVQAGNTISIFVDASGVTSGGAYMEVWAVNV